MPFALQVGRDHVQVQGQVLVHVGVIADDGESAELGQVVGLDVAQVLVVRKLAAACDQVGVQLALDLDRVGRRDLVLGQELANRVVVR
jgi:hypothetical protein